MHRLIAGARRTFLRGILLILPLAITYLILRWLFGLVTGFSTPPAERLLRSLGAPTEFLTYLTPLIAVAITIGVVLLLGLVAGNYLGMKVWESLENLLLRLPLVRWFYGSARQLMDAFRYSGGAAFSEVVLVEYPRRGIWCVGFVTASATSLVAAGSGAAADVEYIYVFVPTTPNPTSGYTVVLPRADVKTLKMSVDDGLKVIFSGGFISPGSGSEDRPSSPPISES
jgi:uncharacterized membrane protein